MWTTPSTELLGLLAQIRAVPGRSGQSARAIVLGIGLLVASVGSALEVHGQTASTGPFMIGLLFDDGVLQPLMHFSGGTWTTPWPTEGGVPVQPPRIDLPASVAQIPSTWWPGLDSAAWRVALPTGVRQLRLVKPASIHAGCGDLVPAIQTDYDGPRRSANRDLISRVGPAFAGAVTVRRATTIDISSPRGAVWRRAEARLRAAVRRHGGSPEGLTLQLVSRMPAEDGGVMWSLVALAAGRSVTVWESVGGAPFEHVVDRATEPDHELSGVVTPIASIWGLRPLTLLAWEQGFDGGQFTIVSMASGGMRTLAAAGGGSC